MYEYQKKNSFFAQVTGMMEELCAEELAEFGAKNIKTVYRGISFEADTETLYKINYNSRLTTRILAPLIIFRAVNANGIMKASEKVKWENIFPVTKTFAISSSVTKSQINNSLYAAQCMKDGIADYFRNKFGRRPDVNIKNPDVRFNLHIEKDIAVLSLDTSGESLHKRGYRLLAGEAPMQETLAAAIIRISKWNGDTPLLDCMCGSGTIICEALMHYCRIPAQKLRKNFGFFYMPDFNENIWQIVKEESDNKIRPLPENLIWGNDLSEKTLRTAKDNLSRLPYSESVKLTSTPFQHIKKFEDGTLVTNPPYGIRLGKTEEVQKLYKELGDFLKTKCKGTSAYIYTGNPSLRKSIGLRTSKRIPLVNGKLEGVLLHIKSYEGSKKKKYLKDGQSNV